VSKLLNKGITLKFYELVLIEYCDDKGEFSITEQRTNTYFKMISGKVYVKNRKVKYMNQTTKDGWEIHPLEFQDWWVDIIVDGNLEMITFLHFHDEKESTMWSKENGIVEFSYLCPPPGLDFAIIQRLTQQSIQSSSNLLTLKELVVLTYRDNFGKSAIDELEYTFDSQMMKAAYTPYVWWVPMD
jgi:hypothetical protein